MDIAIDFDLTIVKADSPLVASSGYTGAIETILELQSLGHNVIITTTRTGAPLTAMSTYLTLVGVTPDAINIGIGQTVLPVEAPPGTWTNTDYKVDADMYIDVKSLGCPLTIDQSLSSGDNVFSAPRVDWAKIREYLVLKGILPQA